jgi:predicted permease
VVLSYAYWRARFGGAMDVLGKPIVISNQPMTIVGVAAKGFDGLNLGTATQVFVPITYLDTLTPIDNGLTDRRLRWFNVFARLRPGVTPEQAQAALQPFYASRLRMEVDEPGFARASAAIKAGFLRGTIGVTLASHGRSDLGDTLREPLWALMAIVGCVLLIACANVANLLLARGSARQREIAVRLALGATRGRIVRQLLIESLVLAIGGALIGMAFARFGASALIEFFHDPADTLTVSADPNLRVLAFTLTIAIATGLLFGLLPARQSTAPALGPTLKNEAGSVVGGSHARLRRALVAVQVGLSLLLLIGAGLFIRSLHNLTTIDTGIDTTRLLSFSVDPRLNGYSHSRYHLLRQTLLDRIRATPGVTAAAYASQALLTGGSWNSSIIVEGHTPERDERTISLNNTISPGYFETLGMRLQTGRTFDTHDLFPLPPAAINRPSPQPVAIVNQTFVKRFIHDGPVLGRHMGMGRDPHTPTTTEIIGVVSDAKYSSVRDEIRPQVFYPYRMGSDAGLVVYVRTTQAEDAMFETLRRVMHDIDPNLPLYAMERFQARVDRSLSNERLVGSLSTVFGLLATLLAMTGLYGVMAYSVTRRTREIGLRMAMGASVPQVAWLVMRDALTLVAIGVAVGVPAAWFAGRYIESQLYQVQPADPIVMAGAVLGLTVVAAAAGLVPAWRATRVNPVIALRYE